MFFEYIIFAKTTIILRGFGCKVQLFLTFVWGET